MEKKSVNKGILADSLKQSFVKLAPRIQIKNPVMLVVYIGAILTTALYFLSFAGIRDESSGYILAIALILWFTVLFANFAESIAEGRALDHGTRLFLRMIASQVAMALERQHLSDEQRNIIVEAEKEKMRSNLLRAIAHDLRTPLAGILGASSAIRESGKSLDEMTREKLNADIQEEAQWLIRMVENLLSVTRINETATKVTKSPEAGEEVVAEAVSRIQKRFSQRTVIVRVPDDLLEVPMDGTLIAQVLINLLENAIKYSPSDSPVEVYLKKNNEWAVFEVADHGKGIADEDFPYLFTSYVPNGSKSPDSSRGMGIGLSICLTIIKAHNGTMEAVNRDEGGALFRFALPLKGSE